MPRRPTLEDRLNRLADLRSEPDSEVVRRELEKALGDRSNHLVGRAAKLAAEFELEELAPAMTAAFDRCMDNPEGTDKGCVAKAAIVRALVDLEVRAEEVFLRGVRHRQLEGAYGGPVDTAVPVRAASAEGLLIARSPDLGLEMADLLVDPETEARVAAARVLAASGRGEAEPMLRLKAQLGDAEGEVTGEAIAGLLAIAPQRSLTFVAPFLRSEDPAIVEAAALALGESRLEEAVPLLSECAERTFDPRLRRTLLISLSMLRRPAGFDFLLSQVEIARRDQATHAIVALGLHRGDEALRERTEAALARRGGDRALHAAFAQAFDG
ncbi:MAG: HEAT repeat domain-containing protein [Acidobacteriota bacterium]